MLAQDTPYPSAGSAAPHTSAPTEAAGPEATKKRISWVIRTTSATAPYTTRLRVVCGRSGNGPRVTVPVSTSDSAASAVSISATAARRSALAATGAGGSGTGASGISGGAGQPGRAP